MCRGYGWLRSRMKYQRLLRQPAAYSDRLSDSYPAVPQEMFSDRQYHIPTSPAMYGGLSGPNRPFASHPCLPCFFLFLFFLLCLAQDKRTCIQCMQQVAPLCNVMHSARHLSAFSGINRLSGRFGGIIITLSSIANQKWYPITLPTHTHTHTRMPWGIQFHIDVSSVAPSQSYESITHT